MILVMSVLPSSAAFLSAAMINANNSVSESFQNFFECWLVEQNQHLQDLISASKQFQNNNNGDDQVLGPLIHRVVDHYEGYYRVKSRWVNLDVMGMFCPSWRSLLEDSFLWIGGWRPTMAFHLLYSKSGLQLEAKLHDLIRGLSTGDLADLSPSQLTRVDGLQRVTIKEERGLTEKLAKHQETVADSSMVELSHVVTELMSSDEDGCRQMDDQVESTLESKEEKLGEIFHKADDLRLKTLKDIVDILSPIQTVHFLIAAAELHLRLHDWGKNRDAMPRLHHGGSS